MRSTIMLLATALGLVAPAAAQNPPSGPPPERREAFDTSGLGLTADQRTKIKGILEQMKEKNAPYRKQLDEVLGGRRLRDLTPAERDSLKPKLDPIRHEMAENWRKAHDKINEVLTPEQRKLVEQRMKERRAARGEGPPS
jgi:Spy/CpxP family protein refolding chaperone